MAKRTTKAADADQPGSDFDFDTLKLVANVGKLVYGEHGWQEQTMRGLGYNRVTWHRWVKNISPTPPLDELRAGLVAILRAGISRRADEAAAMIETLALIEKNRE